MKEIQKENDELGSKLAKKERECEAKATEKVGWQSVYSLLLKSFNRAILCSDNNPRRMWLLPYQ